MKAYRKTIAAAASAIAGIASFLADGEVSQNDIIGSAALILGVLAVYAARNQPTPEGN